MVGLAGADILLRVTEDHAAARWHHAKRAGRLRGQISLTILDLDDVISMASAEMKMQLNIVRNRLCNALREDREGE